LLTIRTDIKFGFRFPRECRNGGARNEAFTDLLVTNVLKIFHGKAKSIFGKLITVFSIILLFVLVVFLSHNTFQQNLARLDVIRLYFHEPAIDPIIISQKAVSISDGRMAGIINYKSGNYTNAEPLLMKAIQQNSGDPIAYYFLGNTLYKLGNLENALIEWRLADASSVAQTFVLGAGQADLEGDEAHLVEYARIAVDLDPKNSRAYYFLGRWNYKQGALQEALSSYVRAEALSREKALLAKIYRGTDFVYSDSGDHALTAQFLVKAIEQKPPDRRYYYYLDLAGQYMQLGRYNEAIRQTDLTIQIYENVALAYKKKGDAFVSLGQKEQAIEYYLRSIEVDPESQDKQNAIKAWASLAKIYHQLRLVEEEERAWKSLLDIDPGNPDAVQGLNGFVP
jgi:tetratricopeptide (TPR) repeat protein